MARKRPRLQENHYLCSCETRATGNCGRTVKTKTMKKLLILFAMGCLAVGMTAQTINFAVLPAEGGEALDASTQSQLETKLKQVLTRNSAGAAGAYCVFGVQPQLNVTDTRSTTGVSGTVTVARGELVLVALNVVDGSLYHSAAITLTAKVDSQEDAAKALVQNVKPTDKQFTRFVRLAKEKIETYYADNCAAILSRAQGLYAQGKYHEAASYLAAISESVPCYEQASDLLGKLTDYVTEQPDTIVVTRRTVTTIEE